MSLEQLEVEMIKHVSRAEAGLEWAKLEEIKGLLMEDRADLDQSHLLQIKRIKAHLFKV